MKKEDAKTLPRVYFDKHLYVPILLQSKNIDKISPAGLVEGVGFQLQWSSFYPDFIMWLKNGKRQIIVFIDPKGLEHTS